MWHPWCYSPFVRSELLLLKANFSHVSNILIRWWYQFCTKYTFLVIYNNASSLKQTFTTTWLAVQNTTLKTKYRDTRTSLITGETHLLWKGNSSYTTCGTRGVTLATNPVISHEWGNDRIVFTTNKTYQWSFVTVFCRSLFVLLTIVLSVGLWLLLWYCQTFIVDICHSIHYLVSK
jgi:hypothetical protein